MKLKVFMVSKKNYYNASGIYEDGKLTVLKGSKIREKNMNFQRMSLIEDLRNNKNVVDENNIIKKDVIFNSPSTAAQFVGDSSRNGLLYWRNKDNVKLRDIIGGKNG